MTVTTSREAISIGEWTSRTPEETFALGQEIGQSLTGGEVFLLEGALGAGKTIFVKGVATALGVPADEVTSPSFTLVNRYDEGRLLLYHVDLYRLEEGRAAAHAVDLEELLADESAVLMIEWAGRLGPYRLPETTWRISIEGDGDLPRRINIKR